MVSMKYYVVVLMLIEFVCNVFMIFNVYVLIFILFIWIVLRDLFLRVREVVVLVFCECLMVMEC